MQACPTMLKLLRRWSRQSVGVPAAVNDDATSSLPAKMHGAKQTQQPATVPCMLWPAQAATLGTRRVAARRPEAHRLWARKVRMARWYWSRMRRMAACQPSFSTCARAAAPIAARAPASTTRPRVSAAARP